MAHLRRVVFITGAGVSREMGLSTPLPMMPEWSTSLVNDLNASEQGLAQAIGLSPDMAGDDFEMQLGRFLRFTENVELLESFNSLGAAAATQGSAEVRNWFTTSKVRIDRAIQVIRRNLYDNFNNRKLNMLTVAQTYQDLLEFFLNGDSNSRFAFATTNYDLAIEYAFPKVNVIDGFQADSPWATPIFNPTTIIPAWQADETSMAALHLHGAVGWYRNEEGQIERHPGDKGYNATLGTPALLLPDKDKTISSLPGAEVLWQAFETFLGEASHIVIIGHSLNDKHLVEFLNANAHAPVLYVAYAAPDITPADAQVVETKAREDLSSAGLQTRTLGITHGAFGPGLSPFDEIDVLKIFLDAGDNWNNTRD